MTSPSYRFFGASEQFASAAPVNAMTVDVEEYFQVSAFEGLISRSDWANIDGRVTSSVDIVLDLFADAGISATFFTLAWVAERHPMMIRKIVELGHELASHGCDHTRASTQTRAAFRADVRASKDLLEDIGGAQVLGYRAASYSINAENLWALEELSEAGYRYSSSIYPVRHDLYGMPDAPRFPFRLSQAGILEVPVSTVPVLGRNIPFGGGGYFRLFPYRLSRWGIDQINRNDHQPAVFYFHPWEVDPGQPRVPGASWRTRFRHYLNLDSMQTRLRRLSNDYRWDRMDRIFIPNGAAT